MTDARSIRDEPFALPEDLCEWLNSRALPGLVLEAVHLVEQESNLRRILVSEKLRALLRVLVYSYGSGLFASEEVYRRIRVDTVLLELAAGTSIGAEELRRFRRYYRPILERTLGHLLQLACDEKSDNAFPRFGAEADAERFFERIAESLINQAALRDMMALDY